MNKNNTFKIGNEKENFFRWVVPGIFYIGNDFNQIFMEFGFFNYDYPNAYRALVGNRDDLIFRKAKDIIYRQRNSFEEYIKINLNKDYSMDDIENIIDKISLELKPVTIYAIDENLKIQGLPGKEYIKIGDEEFRLINCYDDCLKTIAKHDNPERFGDTEKLFIEFLISKYNYRDRNKTFMVWYEDKDLLRDIRIIVNNNSEFRPRYYI